MNGWELLPRIVALLAVAVAMGLLMRRLGQNAIVGYLLAGLLLGPTGIKLVQSDEDISVLSELGVALMMFTVGLEFSFERLQKLGKVATLGGTLQVLLTAGVIYGVARLFGISSTAGIALGLAFAMSSTAVVLRELADRSQLESAHGRNATGLCLLQDISVIPVMILLNTLTRPQTPGALILEIGTKSLIVVGFVAAAWAVSKYILPRLFVGGVLSGNREIPVIIAVCTGVGAGFGAHVLGFSPSLGAFAAGIVLAESPFSTQIRADVMSLTSVFVTLFFASVGTAAHLPLSLSYIATVIALGALVMLIKTVMATVAVWIVQRSLLHALMTGLAISQVGEFTFVVSATAYASGILPEPVFQIATGISLLTLIVTPLVIGAAPAIAMKLLPGSRLDFGLGHTRKEHRRQVLVIGLGTAGRAVVRAFQARQIPFSVVEFNPQKAAEAAGDFHIGVGDATQPEVLEHNRVHESVAVIVTVPDPGTSNLIVAGVRQLAPGVPVLARLRHHHHYMTLSESGADYIIDEEDVTGLHMAGEAIDLVEAEREANQRPNEKTAESASSAHS